ncbi:hypothetical protein ACFU7Y_32085 [Kitasatospora sp. NPDC057542]|uniref:hypothetical protein n=1 Tax=Kitasatospora sp. NPDC057542 TaxID=3346162 RepID=UPI003680BBBD
MNSVVVRHALIGLKVLPVVLVVVLSAPAWLSWPFLPERRQQFVLAMVKALADWTQGTSREDTADTAVGTDQTMPVIQPATTTPDPAGLTLEPAEEGDEGADMVG